MGLAFPPVELISADQVEAIHRASLGVLRNTGIEILSKRVLDLLRRSGVDVDRDNGRARFDPDFVEETVATAPARFTLHARNPEHDVEVGGSSLNFCNATTPPYCTDLDRGRRPGSRKDLEELLSLLQALNTVHLLYGYPVEAQDLPTETRHLDCYRAYITNTDKCWRVYALSPERVSDGIEMARIARGVPRERLAEEPSVLLNMNTNSPMRIDGSMAEGLMEMSSLNQPVVISAFTMAGAMAPVTLAGALVQQNAEVLAGMVLTQLARPGAPVVYGSFTSSVHMRSGSISLGTPEYVKAALASGQLARRYKVPFKSSNVNSSNAVDVQAAYESAMAIWGSVLGRANLMAHGLGWLESGLSTSYEKLIVDAEMLQMMSELMRPMDFDTDSLAVDAIDGVGPGGHFFDSPHTLERYTTAFYEPLLSDWRSYDAWLEAGARDATARANGIWKQLLADYEKPDIDPGTLEELDTFVARRRSEIESG